jgi:hypothetical protein
MGNFVVERADGGEEKSIQEIEQALLDRKAEEDNGGTPPAIETPPVDPITPNDTTPIEPVTPEIDDKIVLAHIKNKYGKEVSSIDELFQKPQSESDDLPEDLKMYAKYKKETGRSYDEFLALNKDWNQEDPSLVLKNYLKAQNPELDSSDIEFMMEEFTASEYADETETRSKKIAFNRELKKAKDHFNGLKEQYKVPLESSDTFVQEDTKKKLQAFEEYQKSLDETQALNAKKSEVFTEKTNSLFTDTFEGFDVTLGDKVMKYKPADAATLREQQSNLMNFVGKFLSEDGTLKDGVGFHKAIAAANDADKFAQWAYEAGRAAEAEEQAKNAKNIDMLRKPQQSVPKAGITYEVERDGNVTELKMKKRNN